MTGGIGVRRLHAGEERVLDRVADGVFDATVDRGRTAAMLRDPRHLLFVAIDAGVVVGFASGVEIFHPDKPPELFVNEIGVAPTFRRRGLGRRLLGELLAAGRTRGCVAAWVGTEQSNVAATGLYESFDLVDPPEDFVMFTFRLDEHRPPRSDIP